MLVIKREEEMTAPSDWKEINTQPDRIRINVSTSVKGIKTYDVTVESYQGMDHTVAEHKKLVLILDGLYPNNPQVGI